MAIGKDIEFIIEHTAEFFERVATQLTKRIFLYYTIFEASELIYHQAECRSECRKRCGG
jgi:hypothetical protein